MENILLKEFDPSLDIFYIKVNFEIDLTKKIFKSQNVWSTPQITDFGLSSQRETAGTESMFEDYCGTPLYMGKHPPSLQV